MRGGTKGAGQVFASTGHCVRICISTCTSLFLCPRAVSNQWAPAFNSICQVVNYVMQYDVQ